MTSSGNWGFGLPEKKGLLFSKMSFSKGRSLGKKKKKTVLLGRGAALERVHKFLVFRTEGQKEGGVYPSGLRKGGSAGTDQRGGNVVEAKNGGKN